MTYRGSIVAAAACVAVIGMAGCSSSSATKKADKPEDGIVTPAVLDENTTKIAVGLMAKNGFDGMGSMSTVGSLAISENVTPAMGEDKYEDKDVTVTVPCAFEGDYEFSIDQTYVDAGNAEQWDGTRKITFNNCVHTEPLIGDSRPFDGLEAVKYTHSGSKQKTYSKVSANGVDTKTEEEAFDNLVISAADISDGEEVAKIAVNLVRTSDRYRSYSQEHSSPTIMRMTDTENGTALKESGGYDANGTALRSYNMEAIDFEINYTKEFNVETTVINGYAEETYAGEINGNPKKLGTAYVYGEDFTAVRQGGGSQMGLSGNKVESFNGVFGTTCLGGSVTFATTTAWETNTSIPQIGGGAPVDISEHKGHTPFVGTTTLTGLDSNASVTFDIMEVEDQNVSYGTVMRNGEVEETNLTRWDMKMAMKEICNPNI